MKFKKSTQKTGFFAAGARRMAAGLVLTYPCVGEMKWIAVVEKAGERRRRGVAA